MIFIEKSLIFHWKMIDFSSQISSISENRAQSCNRAVSTKSWNKKFGPVAFAARDNSLLDATIENSAKNLKNYEKIIHFLDISPKSVNILLF